MRRDQSIPPIQHHQHQDDAEDQFDGLHEVNLLQRLVIDQGAKLVQPAREVG